MSESWGEIQERLVAGDPLACLELGRLITSILRQLRAYDFEDEWDDLRQEVSWAVIENARRGRLRDPGAFVGYVRVITRNKFMDRLKRRMKLREHEVLAWEEEWLEGIAGEAGDGSAENPWEQVEQLPDDERELVIGIYRDGYTYAELAQRSEIPLGTLKHRLRRAVGRLREALRAEERNSDDR